MSGLQVSRLLTAINQLSLDAPLVAMTWQWAFANSTGTHLGWKYYAVLGGSVWCLYVLDRALDALRSRPATPTVPRHAFAHRHFGGLFAVGSAAFVLMVVSSFLLLPLRALLSWIGLATVVATYFAVVHWIRPARMLFPKELLVAFLFAAGSAVFVLSTQPSRWTMLLIPFSGALLLFFGNTCSISKWEQAFDRRSYQNSIALDFPRFLRLLPSYLAGLAVLAFLVPAFGMGPWRIGLSIGVSSLLLWALDLRGPRMGLSVRRELADLALLTPWLVGFFR